jgi:diguanylate cyclase (GGDEF)-like protein
LVIEEERFRRFGDPACVVVMDLDRLKVVNDTQGHGAGDHYIRRAADVLARLGGDEFGIVAPGMTPEQASERANQCHSARALSRTPLRRPSAARECGELPCVKPQSVDLG